ncbi:MAG: DUF1643 domain-containing protein [Porphyromonas sp.]|nr:DUF1643 domain-containing protein [Porphyromonas sp.]
MIGNESTLRYILASECTTPLVVIGVNPSTANETKPDPTVRKVMGFAERNDCDGFIMLNLYPQRSTDFACLHQERSEELHQNNLDAIKQYFDGFEELKVLVAWGNLVSKRTYLLDCFKDIASVLSSNSRRVSWLQIGTLTNSKHPRHPLYARYDSSLQPFDIDDYLKKIK